MLFKDWIIGFLNRKALKNSETVELSTGKVYLKRLTNGMVNKAREKSCINGSIINDPLFFTLIDYQLTNLSKREIDNLSVQDGEILRTAVRDVLLKEKVIKVSDSKEEFNEEDKKWFKKSSEKTKAEAQDNLQKLAEGTGQIPPGMDLNG